MNILDRLEEIFVDYDGNDFPSAELGEHAQEATKLHLVVLNIYRHHIDVSFSPLGRKFFQMRVALRHISNIAPRTVELDAVRLEARRAIT